MLSARNKSVASVDAWMYNDGCGRVTSLLSAIGLAGADTPDPFIVYCFQGLCLSGSGPIQAEGANLFPWRCALGFMSALFGGKDVNLNNLISQFGQVGTQQTGQGQKYENQAGDFFSSLVSGDAGKISQTLAPQISAEKTANQQSQKTAAEMGTRSGGTAASNAASSDKLHSDITNMIGSLTRGAAGSLASLGSNMTSTGLGALGQEQGATAQRMQNWSDSILGRGITTAVSAAETYALGGMSGGGGAGGA